MKLHTSLPLIAFTLLLILLAIGLTHDPRKVPSPLIGKPAPTFSLPQLQVIDTQWSSDAFTGKVWILNVWASWCGSCRAEHRVLEEMQRTLQVPIVGVNYKDENYKAKQWLKELGNPYAITVVDQDGRTGIDWGVYAVPETYVIDKQGLIRYKHTGPIDYADIAGIFIKLIKELEQES